jgi:hypothetical protein
MLAGGSRNQCISGCNRERLLRPARLSETAEAARVRAEFEAIEEILDASLPRAAQRASWWETLRSPQERMPQREACLAAGYIATRLPDGKGVRFKRMK